MLGNLMKESGAVERLTKASSEEIANIVTLFLGLAIGSTMVGEQFLNLDTLKIMCLGLLAFGLDGVAGVMFAKILNLFSKNKINPIIGAARTAHSRWRLVLSSELRRKKTLKTSLLMHAMGANAAGQVASVVAGGVLLALMGHASFFTRNAKQKPLVIEGLFLWGW